MDQAGALGETNGGIEFDQDVAGPDRLAVLDADRANDAGFIGPDTLHPRRWNDLALSDGDHVDLHEARPGDRGADGGGERPGEDARRTANHTLRSRG